MCVSEINERNICEASSYVQCNLISKSVRILKPLWLSRLKLKLEYFCWIFTLFALTVLSFVAHHFTVC